MTNKFIRPALILLALVLACALPCAAQPCGATPLAFVDNYLGNVDTGGYTAGAGTLTLVSGTGLPSGATCFYLEVRAEGSHTRELFLVTNRSGATLTVTGAQANTSASDHAAGATVAASMMTAGAFAQLKGDAGASNLLSETRTAGTVATASAKQSALAHGATATLLNISGSAGYVSHIWIALQNTETVAKSDSNLTITVDGVTVFNDRYLLYFGAEYLYAGVNFHNRWIGGQAQSGSNIVGVNSYIPIPFSNSISITLTSAAVSASSNLWYTVSYQTGIPDTWPRTRKLKVASGTVAAGTLAVDTTATLVNATSLSQGRLLGVYMSIDGFPGTASPVTAGLEGRVKIYLDGAGSPQYQSSGTEDYFEWANYFQGTSTNFGAAYSGTQVPYSMDLGQTGIQYSTMGTTTAGCGANVPCTWNAYRFHILDPILFSNALKVTWDAGYSATVNYTGTYRLAYAVWYYTE